jgi:hypothetical protein
MSRHFLGRGWLLRAMDGPPEAVSKEFGIASRDLIPFTELD